MFVILTAADAAYLNFGKDNQRTNRQATLAEMKRYRLEGHFQPGSMGPKVAAVIEFFEEGGKKGIVTSPQNLLKSIKGEYGTTIARLVAPMNAGKQKVCRQIKSIILSLVNCKNRVDHFENIAKSK